eukprot:1180616-Rhodomonas_salina.8
MVGIQGSGSMFGNTAGPYVIEEHEIEKGGRQLVDGGIRQHLSTGTPVGHSAMKALFRLQTSKSD